MNPRVSAVLMSVAVSAISATATLRAEALTIKDIEYTTRTDSHPCEPAAPSGSCAFDTFVVAKAKGNPEVTWERRIYFVKYPATAKLRPEITVKSFEALNAKSKKPKLKVVNSKGDTFELETAHGHMLKPEEPVDYSAK